MNDPVVLLRVAATVVSFGFLLAWAWDYVAARIPRRGVAPVHRGASVVDLRLVLDLAARLRDAGKADAVKLCQQLMDEMLKPEAQ